MARTKQISYKYEKAPSPKKSAGPKRMFSPIHHQITDEGQRLHLLYRMAQQQFEEHRAEEEAKGLRTPTESVTSSYGTPEFHYTAEMLAQAHHPRHAASRVACDSNAATVLLEPIVWPDFNEGFSPADYAQDMWDAIASSMAIEEAEHQAIMAQLHCDEVLPSPPSLNSSMKSLHSESGVHSSEEDAEDRLAELERLAWDDYEDPENSES